MSGSDFIALRMLRGKSHQYRWWVCALLFFATTVNYMDRQVLGILAPVLQVKIGWNQMNYGWIVTAFQAAYAVGMLFAGKFMDRVGTKIGYGVSTLIWSVAAVAHAFARTAFEFALARFALGFGESGNFPAAIKATAEWFPKKERALVTGIFNSGANIGAVIAPAIVPWITLTWGWPAAFVFTGALGFIWVMVWSWVYRVPERRNKLSREELRLVEDGNPDTGSDRISWASLLRHKQTWALVIGKFLTDPIWWFYLYWLPLFLNQRYGLDLSQLGFPLIVVYTMTSAGSISGGWLSGHFIKKGWTVNKSRKIVMLACAVLIVPILFVTAVPERWAIFLIGVAAASHQGWSANLFTAASDMFPKETVGSVIGLAGMAGAIGGMLISTAAGIIIQLTGTYVVLFAICGAVYIIALFVFQLLAPRMEVVHIRS